jgi:hypothetical protein
MPLLSCLSSISLPFSFPYDFMHFIWENVVKNLFFLWSGTFKGVGTDFTGDDFVLSKDALAQVGKMGQDASSSIPYAFGPRPPNIASDKVSWTAETRAFYAQHIAPSVFRRHMRAKYFKHFVSLIKLLSQCVDYEMPREKLPEVRAGFAAWVQDFEKYILNTLVMRCMHSLRGRLYCTFSTNSSWGLVRDTLFCRMQRRETSCGAPASAGAPAVERARPHCTRPPPLSLDTCVEGTCILSSCRYHVLTTTLDQLGVPDARGLGMHITVVSRHSRGGWASLTPVV